MATRLYGVLLDGLKKPIINATVVLLAKGNTITVLNGSEAIFKTDAQGAYNVTVQSGYYKVIIGPQGTEPYKAGEIAIYADSQEGSLNNYLVNWAEEDLTPEVIKQVKELVAVSEQYSLQAGRSAAAAQADATDARNSKASAAQSVADALVYKNDSKANADAAKQAQAGAAGSANTANAAVTTIRAIQQDVTASKDRAVTAETNAKASQDASANSAGAAKVSETNAKSSETKAKEYMQTAQSLASPLTQYNWPVATGAFTRYVKIAKLSDPASDDCRLTLMVANGGNYGSTYGNIDFIEISARGLRATGEITSENVTKFLSVRRLGSSMLATDNQLRYGLVAGDGYFEVWCFQRAFIRGTKVAVLAQAGSVELYIPDGYVTQTDAPAGYIESKARRIYDEGNKPTKEDVGLSNALLKGDFGLGGSGSVISGKMSDAELLQYLRSRGGQFWRSDKPTGSTATIYTHGSGIFSRCADTWSAINIDYSTGKVKVYAGNDNGLNSGNFSINELYGTKNKPSKSDVGLGNVTNDAQVKKSGDAMSGDLIIQKGTPSLYLRSKSGTAHVWFQNEDQSERGVIWAPTNTASLGEIRIRAKTADGTSTGDFVVRHDGRIQANDAKILYKVSSRTAEFANDNTNTMENTLKISGKQHTPLLLTRTGYSENLSIGFKVDNVVQKYLGINGSGDLCFGDYADHKQNSRVITQAILDSGATASSLTTQKVVLGNVTLRQINEDEGTGIGVVFDGSNSTENTFGIVNTGGGSAVFHNYAKPADSSAVNTGVLIGGYGSRPWTGSTYTEHSNVSQHFLMDGVASATNHGGWFRLLTTPLNATIDERRQTFATSNNGDLYTGYDVPMGTYKLDAANYNGLDILNGRGLKQVNNSANEIALITPRNGSTANINFRGVAFNGTMTGTKGATQQGDNLWLSFAGHDGVKFTGAAAGIRIQASSGWSTTNHQCGITFATTTQGSTTRTDRWSIGSNGDLFPAQDNTYAIGSSVSRATSIFATNGAIQTSDARMKTDVRKMSDAELSAAKDIAREFGFFQWIERVKTEGDAARWHAGITVQRVISIMSSYGLDPMAYGFVCYDSWEEQEVVSVDPDNQSKTITKIEAGDRYSLRYSELSIFIARGLEQRISELEDKLL